MGEAFLYSSSSSGSTGVTATEVKVVSTRNSVTFSFSPDWVSVCVNKYITSYQDVAPFSFIVFNGCTNGGSSTYVQTNFSNRLFQAGSRNYFCSASLSGSTLSWNSSLSQSGATVTCVAVKGIPSVFSGGSLVYSNGRGDSIKSPFSCKLFFAKFVGGGTDYQSFTSSPFWIIPPGNSMELTMPYEQTNQYYARTRNSSWMFNASLSSDGNTAHVTTFNGGYVSYLFMK